METVNDSIQALKNQITGSQMIILILSAAIGILCLLIFIYLMKSGKKQQEEIIHLKDEIEKILTEGFVASTEKNIAENNKKFN